MDYGGIIKRSWTITWKYRSLWILGLFAGITGWAAGGGSSGSGGSGNSPSRIGSSGFPNNFSYLQFQHLVRAWIPVIIAVGLVLFLFSLLWWVLRIAARAGLVSAVDDIESGRELRTGNAWATGFSRWGGTFVLEFLLGLPMFLLVLVSLVIILGPILGPLSVGAKPTVAAIGGVCGGLLLLLIIGLPLSFVVGILEAVGLRYLVLDRLSATAAIGSAWRVFQTRFKDVSLLWLINWGLNIAAGLVFAIPVILISIVFGAGLVVTAIPELRQGNFGPSLIVGIGLLVGLLVLLGWVYQAIWGTYTSSLWTIAFRRISGREIVMAPAVAPAGAAVGYPAPQPAEWQPPAPQPPAPQPPAPQPPAPAPQPPAPQPPAWTPPPQDPPA